MRLRFLFVTMLLVTLFSSCRKEQYVASVTELKLVRMEPSSGYPGAIVKVLGRNFSPKASENKVKIGSKDAKVLDANKWDLTIVLPDLAAGSYKVEVHTPKGKASGLTFLYKAKPEHIYITSIIAGAAGSNNSVDGIGTEALLSMPEGLIPDSKGGFYILQRGTFAVRHMDAYRKIITLPISGVPLNFPWHGALASSGDLYFCNKAANQILKMNSAGVISALPGFDLSNPMAIKFNAEGFGYLANRNKNGGEIVIFKDDVVVKTVSVPKPTCIAFDDKGRGLIGTNDAGYLFLLEKDGSVVKIAGSGNIKGTSGDGTSGNLLGTSTIGFVNGIWCAKDGSIYFCDVTGLCVRCLKPDASGDYSKGSLETISSGFYPSDIVVAEDCSKIYVTSAPTHTIRMIEVI